MSTTDTSDKAGGACQGQHWGAHTMYNPSHPTLLRTPGRYGFPIERTLTGSTSDYFTEKPTSDGCLLQPHKVGLCILDLAQLASCGPLYLSNQSTRQ